jgi:hypothetical protein
VLYRFIYLSAESWPLTQADIDDILLASRRNNTADGITGLLVFHDGRFLQVLEGEKEAVSACVARIRKDPRHDAIFRVENGPVEARAFEGWQMGFARPDDLPEELREAAFSIYELVQPNSPSRGDDPHVRQVVRNFMASFRFLRGSRMAG